MSDFKHDATLGNGPRSYTVQVHDGGMNYYVFVNAENVDEASDLAGEWISKGEYGPSPKPINVHLYVCEGPVDRNDFDRENCIGSYVYTFTSAHAESEEVVS
jgi:hypothetical protein